MTSDYVIHVWWRNGQNAKYDYASKELALSHFAGFKVQHFVEQVVLYDTDGSVISIDGLLNGREERMTRFDPL